MDSSQSYGGTVLAVGFSGLPHVTADKKPATVKDVKSLSEHEQVKLALSAAPFHITKDASVMIYGTDGKLTETKREGTNGFICVPTVMNLPTPDPMCMDASVHTWMTDLMNNAPKTTNTIPGVDYMARDGSHFAKGGQVVMREFEEFGVRRMWGHRRMWGQA